MSRALPQGVPVSFHAFLDTNSAPRTEAAGNTIARINEALNAALTPLGASRVLAEFTRRDYSDDTLHVTVNMTPVQTTDTDFVGNTIKMAANANRGSLGDVDLMGRHIETGSVYGAIATGLTIGAADMIVLNSLVRLLGGDVWRDRFSAQSIVYRNMIVDETTVQPTPRTTPPPVSSSAAGQALGTALGHASTISTDPARNNQPTPTVSPEDGPAWYVVAGIAAGGLLVTGLCVAYIVRSFK